MTGDIINKFDGKYGFLSNFYPAAIKYTSPRHELCGEIEGPTVEHVYQACKAAKPGGYHAILACATAGQAKRKGRAIAMRADWDEIKVGVMLDLLRIKFAIPELRKQLLATGNAYIEEGNTWNDTYWGRCRGKGQNMLGVLIMQVRDELTR